jgi:hypothetical protein
MSGTLEIVRIFFDLFLMAFYRVLDKPISHANIKGNVSSTMSNINEVVDEFSIESRNDFGSLTSYAQPNSRLKRSSTWITIYHLKFFQEVNYIFRMRNE